MGDRGNIVVRQGNDNMNDVWFYTHWNGSEIEDAARKALAKKWRWEDPSYLARIVFDTLTEGSGGETGFGISCSISDNEHDIVVIDQPNQRVFTIKEDELENGRIPTKYKPKAAVSFSGFVKEERLVSEIRKAQSA